MKIHNFNKRVWFITNDSWIKPGDKVFRMPDKLMYPQGEIFICGNVITGHYLQNDNEGVQRTSCRKVIFIFPYWVRVMPEGLIYFIAYALIWRTAATVIHDLEPALGHALMSLSSMAYLILIYFTIKKL